eukprot:5693445-Pleurochrysis_carterae.AAC.2
MLPARLHGICQSGIYKFTSQISQIFLNHGVGKDGTGGRRLAHHTRVPQGDTKGIIRNGVRWGLKEALNCEDLLREGGRAKSQGKGMSEMKPESEDGEGESLRRRGGKLEREQCKGMVKKRVKKEGSERKG